METSNISNSSPNIQTNTRKYWIDYLRIFSSFLVVLIHISAAGWYDASLTPNWIIANIGCTLSHCSVPLFFMMSGLFFLDPKKELPLKKLLTHNVLRIYSIYILAMLGYGFWMLIKMQYAQSIPLDNWYDVFSTLFQGNIYLWFLPTLCGLYLITPLLRFITASGEKGKKAIEYYLIVFIIIKLFVFTISALYISTLLNTILKTYLSFQPFNSYLAYFFLGYYLNTYELPKKIRTVIKWLFIPSLVFLTGFPMLQVYLGEALKTSIFDHFSIFTFIIATNVFLFFKSRKKRTLSPRAEKVLILCSSCTFGVYILHAFVTDILSHFGLSIWIGPFYLTIPLYAILVFFISLLLSYLIKKITHLFSHKTDK